MSQTSPRVQLVVSGKFIALFLIALAMLGGGYYWYADQQQARERGKQTQERFKTPPYFVNRGASVIRSCQHCLEAGKLSVQNSWKIAPPQEIPATDQRWFLAVEDPPLPITVSGILMLPVHPAYQDNPSFGFDQTKVMLVLFQNLERKPTIEQSAPPSSPATPPSDPPQPVTQQDAGRDEPSSPADDVIDPRSVVGEWRNTNLHTQSVTKIVITGSDGLEMQAWGKCYPTDCDWGLITDIPKPTGRSFAVVWDHGFAENRLELSLERTGQLKVLFKTHFKDNSGRRDFDITEFFTKAVVP
jgi:hypothetical protein